MLHLGRGRLRRGLAAALIGEIAAVIDGMEGFEEVRKLEGMAIGADDILTSSELSHCRDSRSTSRTREAAAVIPGRRKAASPE